MQNIPGQWMARQQQSGHRLCLMLEGSNEACEAMLATRGLTHCRSLYAETLLAELGRAGPVILLLEQLSEPALLNLLQAPETNWGWLGSLPSDDLAPVTLHWRDRLLVGTQGEQALYRVHDNRTLARALTHLNPDQWPAFLGPMISVCYWHEGRWCCDDNPAPGEYAVPDPAPWLAAPNPNTHAILHANILRYLLAEHSEDLAALMELQDPRAWLTHVLEQARAWQWRRPEQLEFLVVRKLAEATRSSVIRWAPTAGQTPAEHFERVQAQWQLEGEKNE